MTLWCNTHSSSTWVSISGCSEKFNEWIFNIAINNIFLGITYRTDAITFFAHSPHGRLVPHGASSLPRYLPDLEHEVHNDGSQCPLVPRYLLFCGYCLVHRVERENIQTLDADMQILVYRCTHSMLSALFGFTQEVEIKRFNKSVKWSNAHECSQLLILNRWSFKNSVNLWIRKASIQPSRTSEKVFSRA